MPRRRNDGKPAIDNTREGKAARAARRIAEETMQKRHAGRVTNRRATRAEKLNK